MAFFNAISEVVPVMAVQIIRIMMSRPANRRPAVIPCMETFEIGKFGICSPGIVKAFEINTIKMIIAKNFMSFSNAAIGSLAIIMARVMMHMITK
ncbi:MAG: hypothetical protein FWE25_10155 [Lachnospiraceae bacterium]|nr:hypothetical protein [Lachnospiraceae bacterium]